MNGGRNEEPIGFLKSVAAAGISRSALVCFWRVRSRRSAGQIHGRQQSGAAEPRAGEQGNPARPASEADGREAEKRADAGAAGRPQASDRGIFRCRFAPASSPIPRTFRALPPSPPGCSAKAPRRRTSAQIADEVDTLGASLNAGSGFGSSSTSVNASGLINDAARNPGSDERHRPASRVSGRANSHNTSSASRRTSNRVFRIRVSSRSARSAAFSMWTSRFQSHQQRRNPSRR